MSWNGLSDEEITEQLVIVAASSLSCFTWDPVHMSCFKVLIITVYGLANKRKSEIIGTVVVNNAKKKKNQLQYKWLKWLYMQLTHDRVIESDTFLVYMKHWTHFESGQRSRVHMCQSRNHQKCKEIYILHKKFWEFISNWQNYRYKWQE